MDPQLQAAMEIAIRFAEEALVGATVERITIHEKYFAIHFSSGYAAVFYGMSPTILRDPFTEEDIAAAGKLAEIMGAMKKCTPGLFSPEVIGMVGLTTAESHEARPEQHDAYPRYAEASLDSWLNEYQTRNAGSAGPSRRHDAHLQAERPVTVTIGTEGGETIDIDIPSHAVDVMTRMESTPGQYLRGDMSERVVETVLEFRWKTVERVTASGNDGSAL